MTDDFSKSHRGVAYFGIWATETADDYGRRDASTVLAGAVEICMDEAMRRDREVIAALAYLTRQGHDKRAALFRKALDVQTPHERRQAAAHALTAINDSLELAFRGTRFELTGRFTASPRTSAWPCYLHLRFFPRYAIIQNPFRFNGGWRLIRHQVACFVVNPLWV